MIEANLHQFRVDGVYFFDLVSASGADRGQCVVVFLPLIAILPSDVDAASHQPLGTRPVCSHLLYTLSVGSVKSGIF